jgi:hypothetical protein
MTATGQLAIILAFVALLANGNRLRKKVIELKKNRIIAICLFSFILIIALLIIKKY